MTALCVKHSPAGSAIVGERYVRPGAIAVPFEISHDRDERPRTFNLLQIA